MLRLLKIRSLKNVTSTKNQSRHFSRNIHKIDTQVPLVPVDKYDILYRGIKEHIFDEIAHFPVFNAEGILLGMPSCFSGYFPNATNITNYEAAMHKAMPMFTSLSYDIIPSLSFRGRDGKGALISINLSNLPDLVIIDPEEAFKKQFGSSYEHGNEKEVTVFSVLYCSIKSIDFRGDVIDNPFYLPIAKTDTENCLLLQELYDIFCNLQHQTSLYDKNSNRSKESQVSIVELLMLKAEYFKKFFALYEKVLGKDNPFNMPMLAFTNQFPVYSRYFLHQENTRNHNKFFSLQKQNRFENTSVLQFLAGDNTIKDYLMQFQAFSHRQHVEKDVESYLSVNHDLRQTFKIKK